jgi:molecular chaperone DnaK (HSP70)
MDYAAAVRTLAVDLGTSNTVAALRIGSAEPRLLGESLPSAVWLDPGGRLVVGRDAERQARLDAARFEPTPKLRVGEGQVLLGNTTVPVVDLLAGLLGHVFTEARRLLGGGPDQLVLTHPAGWGRAAGTCWSPRRGSPEHGIRYTLCRSPSPRPPSS